MFKGRTQGKPKPHSTSFKNLKDLDACEIVDSEIPVSPITKNPSLGFHSSIEGLYQKLDEAAPLKEPKNKIVCRTLEEFPK